MAVKKKPAADAPAAPAKGADPGAGLPRGMAASARRKAGWDEDTIAKLYTEETP